MNKILLLIVCGSLSSCISFTDTVVDSSLPSDVTDRNHLVKTADWRDELLELSGTVLYEPTDKNAPWRAAQRVAPLVEPTLQIIASDNPSRVLAEALVDSGANASLSAVGLGNLSLSGKDKLEFRYEDISRVFIKWDKINHSEILAEKGKPLPPDVKRRWFVQGARLATVHTRKFSEVKGTFKKTVSGDGIGANGGVYNASRTFKRDFAIHVTIRDIDGWPEQPGNNIVATPEGFGPKISGQNSKGLTLSISKK